MREVAPEADWPQSWIESYKYDREGVFGTPTDWGYALAYRNPRKKALELVTDALAPGCSILDLVSGDRREWLC
jgi:hypothetical protein